MMPRCRIGPGWAEVPTPSPQEGEAFVRVIAQALVEWARADLAKEATELRCRDGKAGDEPTGDEGNDRV